MVLLEAATWRCLHFGQFNYLISRGGGVAVAVVVVVVVFV